MGKMLTEFRAVESGEGNTIDACTGVANGLGIGFMDALRAVATEHDKARLARDAERRARHRLVPN